MAKSKKRKSKLYVSHPRYGSQPCVSEYKISEKEIENSFWGYHRDTFFEESAIPADVEKQNYAVFPRRVYVDLERHCRQCNRPFLFFAQEQRYWYEELKFFVDADCVMCIDCRKKEQEIRQLMKEYERVSKIEKRTDQETKKLKQVALELYQYGYIKNEDKINRIA